MTGETWTDDACSLVDAFRRGERSPREELESTFAAIEQRDLNAFSFLDREGALRAAEHAELSRPFGGVPVGVKELERVAGWPQTERAMAPPKPLGGWLSILRKPAPQAPEYR